MYANILPLSATQVAWLQMYNNRTVQVDMRRCSTLPCKQCIHHVLILQPLAASNTTEGIPAEHGSSTTI